LPSPLSSTPSSSGDAYTDDHMHVPVIPVVTTKPFVPGNNIAGEKLAGNATEMEENEAPFHSETYEIATDYEDDLTSDLASDDPGVDFSPASTKESPPAPLSGVPPARDGVPPASDGMQDGVRMQPVARRTRSSSPTPHGSCDGRPCTPSSPGRSTLPSTSAPEDSPGTPMSSAAHHVPPGTTST
jgi:hypothetical protein